MVGKNVCAEAECGGGVNGKLNESKGMQIREKCGKGGGSGSHKGSEVTGHELVIRHYMPSPRSARDTPWHLHT